MWRQGQFPQAFKDATIVQQPCDNHGHISLLNAAKKAFKRTLHNRPNGHLEQGLLSEIQGGFQRHRRTSDMNFTAHQLQQKCQEM
ncbi:unnamed protein product [Schistocephalus solidus]|uniref:Transposase n=1 Tax=Schistocephalus solidus TaxID=70667 RepID=A0A183SQI5_SCHSO|nr:unnamed protein product [Schistocephalus solidus]